METLYDSVIAIDIAIFRCSGDHFTDSIVGIAGCERFAAAKDVDEAVLAVLKIVAGASVGLKVFRCNRSCSLSPSFSEHPVIRPWSS